MGIEFEGELEQKQTSSLADAMINDATAQIEIVATRVKSIRWSAMEESGWCEDLLVQLDNGATISATRARIEGLPAGLREEALAENARQAGPIADDPARVAGEEIMRGVDPPELDEHGDPKQGS